MHRRASPGSQDHFDLFPYIAILMSLLGALLTATLGMASLSLGPGVAETWDMAARDGTASKAPVLVEWDGSALTVHEGAQRRRVPWLDDQAAAAGGMRPRSAAMQRLLAEFGQRSATGYVLFAVRPSGFATLPRLTDDFRAAHIDIGYEPVGQERGVQLLSAGEHP
ncbi:MAG: hypothetical protein AB7F93_09865 [Immundisolibacter sp.]|uniref:hypothetical protein n=1 Tax=Immundisolibacter sp. TaxID=1934948 RepID=UPI003D0C337E